jgi:hypothetical protein
VKALRSALALALPVTILLSALSLSACSGAALVQQGPSDTLRAYAQALEQGRVDDAYRLLSDEAKRSMSLDAFRRAVKENPEDAVEIARAIARPASDPVVTATVTVPSGEELLLVYEAGKWRIDASAVDLYGQATPRQAMLGFLRAVDRKRYDVILRYVPDAEIQGVAGMGEDAAPPGDKDAAAAKDTKGSAAPAAAAAGDAKKPLAGGPAQLTPEKLKTAWEGPQKEQIARIVQAIKTALPTAQIEETGDSAAMSYGAGGTVAFVREHGVWKIKDF